MTANSISNEYRAARIQKYLIDKRYDMNAYDEAVMELYQNYISLLNKDFDVVSNKQKLINHLKDTSLDKQRLSFDEDKRFIWGLKPTSEKIEKLLSSLKIQKLFIEDTFLRSIVNVPQKDTVDNNNYLYSCGYSFDDLTMYYDSTRPSRMELTLNSDFEVPKSEIERCRKLIKKIISNKISKYNNQPIYKPNFGRPNRKKVLVIDQSYKDYSILKGGADDNTFKLMLDSAIKENPDCDILIKTHPDAIGKASKKPVCYYQGVKEAENIFRITDFINPISMIEYVDKVYVCSSQFGFEALMCGKEVHTFGLPFYANWGLTTDNQKLPRRTRKRTLEEIFYITYIMFSVYVNPKTNQPCEIEEAIDYLLELREEYFKEYNVRNE